MTTTTKPDYSLLYAAQADYEPLSREEYETTTYGIVIEDGDAGRVQECPSLDEAHLAAQRVIEGDDGAPAADVVELDGAGPVRDCDGKVIADCHAPRRTIATYERDEPESRYVD
jgi:hypothetical protein